MHIKNGLKKNVFEKDKETNVYDMMEKNYVWVYMVEKKVKKFVIRIGPKSWQWEIIDMDNSDIMSEDKKKCQRNV